MEITQLDGMVQISGVDDFDPEKIFECGQCFRWNPDSDGGYTGVAMGRAARVCRKGNDVFISGTAEDFRTVWYDYFDMGRDYSAIRKSLCIDDYMRDATRFGAGIRILRQDKWEALCSFIISQCNNIPRIKKIVETLCCRFGEPIDFSGNTAYAFPDADSIAALEPEDLAVLRSGYRAPYIISAARAVSSGRLDLDALSAGDYGEALKALKAMPGIGDKVANCVILFSLRMPRAFPIDVWMKKAIAEHYGGKFDPSVFGDNAGLAQQYMFYYQRSGKN